jgi:hypothetical protein
MALVPQNLRVVLVRENKEDIWFLFLHDGIISPLNLHVSFLLCSEPNRLNEPSDSTKALSIAPDTQHDIARRNKGASRG